MKKNKTYTLTLAFLLHFLITSCVQEKHSKTVQFQVDMRGLESITSIGVQGYPTPFNWEESKLFTDTDGDGIFEGTFHFPSAAPGIEFKFVRDGEIFELDCQANREIIFEYRPEQIVYKAVFDQKEPSSIDRMGL